jgi:hypothetical protein
MSEFILADIGDSWSAYPKALGTGGGLGDHLIQLTGGRLLNISRDGDPSEETMGLKNITRLRDTLAEKPNAILITSGGDDFAGDQFRLALNKNVNGDITRAVNQIWFDAALSEIVADYQMLKDERDAISPTTLIISQSYGFPPPEMMGVGVKILGITLDGPWLQPGFVDRGWTKPEDQAAIIKEMLLELEVDLAFFAARDPLHLHVNLQSVLQPEHFANELHLNDPGWTLAAETINERMLPWLNSLAVQGL